MTEATVHHPVLDMGTLFTRFGFADVESSGGPVLTQYQPQSQNTTLAHQAAALKYPLENGYVTDWNTWEDLVKQEWSNWNDTATKSAIIVSEPLFNPDASREKLAQLLFETFNVPAALLTTSAFLSLVSAGKTTGVVLQSGEGATEVGAFYEGYRLPHASQSSALNGKVLTDYFERLVSQSSGKSFNTHKEKALIRRIKSENVFALTRDEKESSGHTSYILPDGTALKFDASDRHGAVEALFNPKLTGTDTASWQHVLFGSVCKVDAEGRQEMFSNIFLGGGNANIPNLAKRLTSEVSALIAAASSSSSTSSPSSASSVTAASAAATTSTTTTTSSSSSASAPSPSSASASSSSSTSSSSSSSSSSYKVNIKAVSNPSMSAYNGGVILSDLSVFPGMCATKDDYNEFGPSVVKRKFFS